MCLICIRIVVPGLDSSVVRISSYFFCTYLLPVWFTSHHISSPNSVKDWRVNLSKGLPIRYRQRIAKSIYVEDCHIDTDTGFPQYCNKWRSCRRYISFRRCLFVTGTNWIAIDIVVAIGHRIIADGAEIIFPSGVCLLITGTHWQRLALPTWRNQEKNSDS